MTNLIRSRSNNLRNLQHEIDRVFDSFFPTRYTEEEEPQKAVWAPRVDLSETDDLYRIELDVPGMNRDDLTISYQDNQLTVSGERREEQQEENGREYVRVERSFGHFYRSFRLPKTVNADNIQANYENGVLTIEVPKAEESKPQRIQIS